MLQVSTKLVAALAVCVAGVCLLSGLDCPGEMTPAGMPVVDSDNDGIADGDDGCPNDANKTDPGICGCGVADADSDGDGVPDCVDPCPNDPNKLDPGICGCGVPDTDTDGDGVADCVDLCPNDPNKLDPGICGCGVPDDDTDGDDVVDCNDLCPVTPIAIPVDQDGCPLCADFSVTAPGTFMGDTTGAGNDCNLRSSEEHIYAVTLPNAGTWTFSLCGSAFDTYLHLGTTCCSADIAFNDDSCGLQSTVTAMLAAGTYFVTIEAFSGAQTGAYTLEISE